MSTLESLLQRPDIWRPRDRGAPVRDSLPTGHAALDEALQGGWPAGALIELLLQRPGVGEWRLLAPWLAEVGRRGQWQLWVDPPFLPFAPALLQWGIDLERVIIVRTQTVAQWLWSSDQALHAPGCTAVVCWAARALRYAELRKLQVVARERGKVAFLLRNENDNETARTVDKGAPDVRLADNGQPADRLNSASPAALRLRLACNETGDRRSEGLAVEVVKQRGCAAGQRVVLPLPVGLRPQLPLRERPCIISTPRPPATPGTPRMPPVHPLSEEVIWQ